MIITLANTTIVSHDYLFCVCVVRKWKISPLNNFQVCDTVSLCLIILPCISSPVFGPGECAHLKASSRLVLGTLEFPTYVGRPLPWTQESIFLRSDHASRLHKASPKGWPWQGGGTVFKGSERSLWCGLGCPPWTVGEPGVVE